MIRVFLKRSILLGALIPLTVFAQEAMPVAVSAPRLYSLTLSPVHLALPVVELTGEYRMAPKVSAALIGGFGSITADDNKFSVIEAGAQARYYPLNTTKHEPHLGVEALWLHIAGDDLDNTDVSGTGAGLAVGPFIGYKYTASFGLTFDSQVGYQFLALKADATDGSSASDSKGIVLLNLNLGWSF